MPKPTPVVEVVEQEICIDLTVVTMLDLAEVV
jgi:hypothetical protein